jgi:outer membrane protein assembly factor BamB/serine/threonine protein kinase
MADYLERIGQTVGDYRLLRWLGGGGFGNVYLAEQIRDGQQVALKILQTRLTQQEDLRAFINEARTMRLRHPHIVPLLDFGLSREDAPFLVMEYAPHGTLRDLHPKGTRVPLSRVVEYARQVGSALQYAHERQLIHRDVKPENMLVREDGSILLSDFGIATVAPSSSSFNSNRGMAGTAAYMPPEQMRGKPRAASDQYALAVVIYEWLAGRLPFEGTALEVVMQHATQPPPSLVAQVPGIPAAVEAVIFKALAKDPAERFASMQEFIAALQACAPATFRPSPSAGGARPQSRDIPSLSPLPPGRFPPVADQEAITPRSPLEIQSMPTAPLTPGTASSSTMRTPRPGDQFHESSTLTGTKERISTPGRKRGTLKGVRALLLALMALLITAGGTYAYSVMNTMRITAAEHQQATATAIARAAATAGVRATATATVKAADDAYNAYVAQHGIMSGFDAAHTGVNPYERILNVGNVSRLHQAWAAPTRGPISTSPVVSNGVVYIGSLDGGLYAFDAVTGQREWVDFTNGPISSTAAVMDGVVYVGSNDDKLYAFDAVTGKQKWAAATGNLINSSPVIVNGVVYVGSNDDKLYAFDAVTGKQKWAAATGGGIGTSPAVANGLIYVSCDDYKLYAFDAATGQQKWASLAGGPISTPAVANGLVYVSSTDGKLYTFDAATGQQRGADPMGAIRSAPPAVANGVAYFGSVDGALEAFDPQTQHLKWAAPTTYPIDTPLTVANGVIYAGSGAGRLYAFDAATGQQKWVDFIGNVISSAPTVVNGIVYVGTGDDHLYAFALPENSA